MNISDKVTRIGLFVSLLTQPVWAIMIAGPDGTAQTNAPSGDQGWSYVGRVNTAPTSTTYISNNWFITAYHVQVLDSPTGVLLGGSAYTIDAGSWTRMTNTTDGSNTDLVMFRVNENVGLSGLSLVSSTPTNGTSVTMIGNGLNRGGPLGAVGYYYGTGNTKRWGSNTKAVDEGIINDGFGLTDTFSTIWNNVPGEGHGATYDSGGGVFVDHGEWELAGIIITSESATNVNGRYSQYHAKTYMASLSSYSDQINDTMAIPEPAVISLLSIFGVGLIFANRILQSDTFV